MGAANSSSTLESSSTGNAVQALTRALNEDTVKQLKLTIQRKFYLNRSDLVALFLNTAKDAVDLTFAVFDYKVDDRVDSCEILGILILVAPQLSRKAKLHGIFEIFNVSTHRKGQLVADEATLLFRTMAVGIAKLHRAIAATTGSVADTLTLPTLAYFEDLTKALYGEQETLTFEAFSSLCHSTPEIDALISQFDSRSEPASN